MDPKLQKIYDEAEGDMKKAIEHLESELAKIRAGKVVPELVEGIKVDYYGTQMPLNQLASINNLDARTLVIKPWDKGALEAIDRAIQEANLGVNPTNDGEVIRLAFPPLSEETRKNLVKKAHQVGEQARIAIRNIRREAIEQVRKLKKEGISEDLARHMEEEIQKLTDKYIKLVDKHIDKKEEEILEV